MSLRFRNLYDPNGLDYRITNQRWDAATCPRPTDLAEVTTYRQLLRRHHLHPEAKYTSTDGGDRGIGWLERLAIRPARLTTMGKESNHLEEARLASTQTPTTS